MQSNAFFEFSDYRLDPVQGLLWRGDRIVPLAPKAFDTLRVLVEAQGRVIGKDELLSQVWPDTFVEEGSLAHNISILRRTLSENGDGEEYIQTIPKRGYRFVASVRESARSSLVEKVAPGASPRFIETKPRQGYRFIAPVEKLSQAVEASPGPAPKKREALVWVVCAAALLAIGVLFWNFKPRRPAAQIHSIAVLPLRTLSPDPDHEYLSASLSELLTTGLAHMGSFDVIASTSTHRYQNVDKPLPQIARELNVDALVQGSVQRAGNRLLITAQLIDGKTARHLWARTYERDIRDALRVQEDIAEAIADEIGSKLSIRSRVRLPHSNNPEAQDSYLRAQFLYRRGDFRKSFALYQQAIEKDPQFAAAYAGMPFGYMLAGKRLSREEHEEGLAKWRAAAKRSLELDPNLAEGHMAFANIHGFYEWNWQEAEKEYKAALALNPNLALAHQQYGMILAFMGRTDEGIQELERARRLDPVAGGAMLGLALWYARRPDDLLALAKRLEDLEDFDTQWVGLFRGYAHQLRGEFDQALHELTRLPEDNAMPLERYLVEQVYAYGALGKRTEARAALGKLIELSKKRKVWDWWFACVYAALGDNDRAFEWLDKAYRQRPSEMISFAASPDMDPLRSDPRFEEMLRRMNLEHH